MYEPLVQANIDHTYSPMLATSWDMSEDLKTWTFHLRQGVQFSSGKVLDAQDVVATYQRLMQPSLGSEGLADISMIESLDALDASTVVFNLNTPYADLQAPLSETWMCIVPAGPTASLAQVPNGTGPFLLTENVPNDHQTFVRNPHYWQPGLPYLDQLVLLIIPEEVAGVTSLANGETDVMWSVPYDQYATVKATPNVVVQDAPSGAFSPLVLDNSKPPFSDPNVRLAFRLAIDAHTIVKVCLLGHGTATPIPISPTDPTFPNVPVVKQDYAKAKQLMAAAGYPNGFTMSLYSPEGRPAQASATIVVQSMLKPLNVTVNIQEQPLDYFFAHTEGNGEAYTDDWGDQPGVDIHIYSQFHSGGFWNGYVWKKWHTAEADSLLDKARASTSTTVRKQSYATLANILNSDGPGVFFYVDNSIQAWRSNVKNLQARPDQIFTAREVWIE
jgi:peptide/nickel transport system substrate-binding protein